jgi:tetratricopeptide (TPR) repeat protein
MQIGLFLTGPPFSGGDAGGGMAGLMGGGDTKEKLTEEQQVAVDQLTLTANLNLAACYLKEEKYEKAAARATKVLEKDAKHVKALFRRGEARIYLNDLDRAREDLKTAESLAPDDKGIKSRLSLLDKREKHFAKQEKRTYAKMFAPAKTAEATSADEAGQSEGQAGGPGPGAAASTDGTPAATSDDGGSASGVEGAPSPTSSPGAAAAAAQDPAVAEALARVAAEGKGSEEQGTGESSYKW